MMETLDSSGISRHKCLIYDGDPSEQLPVIVPLLMNGLKENNRCLYLGNPEMIRMVDAALTAKGVDVRKEAGRGALVFSSDRSHLDDGFNPHSMVDMLRRLIDQSVRDGFKGLCATGDMMWELGTEKNFELLLEYEALLEKVFQEMPLQGICQYHRQTVPARALQDAFLAHQSVYLGDSLSDENLFYMPPDILLRTGDSTVRDQQGEWISQQIIRVMHAERKRDQALAALKESEAEQRRLAEKLAEANKGLEARVKERTAQLEELNKELETFSYSVSHDLRAPLRSIMGFSKALEEDCGPALNEEGRRHLGHVYHSASVMSSMIDGLLKLSRVTREKLKPRMISLTDLATEVADEVRRSQPEREVDFTVAADLTAWGDASLLRIVMQNLIGNAWKYTRNQANPRVEVGTMERDGEKVFFIRDNGAGFSMQYAPKLFGPFQRLHAETEFEGNGIGLATVHRIIGRHKGRIWAEAAIDKGATFFFTLPTPRP